MPEVHDTIPWLNVHIFIYDLFTPPGLCYAVEIDTTKIIKLFITLRFVYP